MSEQSESIAKLAEALAKAQGMMEGAKKDSANPFFKSNYADLAAVWDACRRALSSNGLAVMQTTAIEDQGVTVITTLAHSSGEWMRGRLRMMPVKADPQGIGSCISYARRYALAAMVGVYQVDDDGNAASAPKPKYVSDTHIDVTGQFDIQERDKYVELFQQAFDEDKEEIDIARRVEELHQELTQRHELYIAVGQALGKNKNAIRKYRDILKQAQKVAA